MSVGSKMSQAGVLICPIALSVNQILQFSSDPTRIHQTLKAECREEQTSFMSGGSSWTWAREPVGYYLPEDLKGTNIMWSQLGARMERSLVASHILTPGQSIGPHLRCQFTCLCCCEESFSKAARARAMPVNIGEQVKQRMERIPLAHI